MSNSWNAPPGELSYDDERYGAAPNARCCECHREFISEQDGPQQLCDRCCALRDVNREVRRYLDSRKKAV
jgi:hypothetical protein